MSKGDMPQYAARPRPLRQVLCCPGSGIVFLPVSGGFPGLFVFIDDVVRRTHRGDHLIHVVESNHLAELSFQVFREKLPDPVLDVIHDLVAVFFLRVICFEGIDVFL